MNTQLALSTQFDPSASISLHNGKPVTTSLKVAEAFGKLHKNVIRRLESLECSEEFTRLNFEPSEYIDSTGRKLTMWEMTKDGFMFLVMGFTGTKAAAIKEAYINAFNWMAEQLAKPHHEPIAIDYPAAELFNSNPSIGRTQTLYGAGNALITAKMVCGEARSPTRRLLSELRDAGYNIDACWIEVQAMKYHLEAMLDKLNEIQRKIDVTGRGFRVSADEYASRPALGATCSRLLK